MCIAGARLRMMMCNVITNGVPFVSGIFSPLPFPLSLKTVSMGRGENNPLINGTPLGVGEGS